MFEEYSKMCEILNDVVKKTNGFQRETVLAGFMMILEEWCKANHENMVETFEALYESCKYVNECLGEY